MKNVLKLFHTIKIFWVAEMTVSHEILWRRFLHENCPYLEFFWSLFSHICTEYWGRDTAYLPHSVQMGGNTDQKNSEYKQFSRSALRVKNKLLFSASVFAFYYSQLNLHKYL